MRAVGHRNARCGMLGRKEKLAVFLRSEKPTCKQRSVYVNVCKLNRKKKAFDVAIINFQLFFH